MQMTLVRWAILGVILVSFFVGIAAFNRSMQERIASMEHVEKTPAVSVVEKPVVEVNMHHSNVVIDPLNDPLAPRKKEAPRPPAAPVSDKTYDPAPTGPILTQ